MDDQRFQGLIVAYYLSRHDVDAYMSLGYGSQLAAHKAIGELLSVKHNTIKNWRDEFDSVHDNGRVGWYQRPLRPSRQAVIERFSTLSEQALEHLVKEILQRTDHLVDIEIPDGVLSAPALDDADDETTRSTRADTGRRAEEIFMEFFNDRRTRLEGELVDRRTSGEGYDFEIHSAGKNLAVEVKGLAGSTGGISMTSREWLAARAWKEDYYIALVLNVESIPDVVLIHNPGYRLQPRLSLFTAVQERWSASVAELLRLTTSAD